MSAVDVAPEASFGLRTEQGGPPAAPSEANDGGEAVWAAAFRQTNSVVSALQYLRNSGSYNPVPGYNPVNEIKGWGDQKYFLDHGSSFVGSQSPAETLAIKSQVDQEETDRSLLAANGKIGFVAQLGAGLLDPTLLMPGGVGIDAARGGLTFSKAAVTMGKAGLMGTVSQEALLHATQDTRTLSESAVNVASGTVLSALLGAGAMALLGPAERTALETALHADRTAINEHAGNPSTGEAAPRLSDEQVREEVRKWTAGAASGADTSVIPEAVRRFGRPLDQETTFYRGEWPGRPDFADEKAAISVSDRSVGENFAMMRNETELEKQPHDGEGAPQLPLSEIVVPSGTKIFDASELSANPGEMERFLPPGKFRLEGIRREPFDFGGNPAEHVIKRYRFEPTIEPSVPTGTGFAVAAGAAASDTRQIELVDFGLNQVPGLGRIVDKTSPMQRVFGADSVTARRTGADLAETSLLTKENLEGGVTTAGPAVDREARLLINQGQVSVGDELSRLFSEYRFGEQKTAPRAQALFQDYTGKAEGKMSFDQFKEAVTEAARNGDLHENPQVTAAAQHIRKTVFEPWKERAIKAGLLPEGVDVKTADSYVQRLYNKQAIAAKRPEFVDRVTDWLHADQQAKAEAQTKIGFYQGALESHRGTIDKLQARIEKLETDADVIAARQEETTRINKAANQRSTKLRTNADQDTLPLQNARGGAVFETLARNRGNLLADRASAKLAEIDGLHQKLAAETASHDAMRAKIEEQLATWEGKSTVEAKAALKARAEAEKARDQAKAQGTYKGKDERLSAADRAVDKAVNRILGSDRSLSRDELRSRAHEITDRILGSPDGRLPYDLGMEHGAGHGGSGEPPRGALAAREFNIPDATIADFLENDIEHIVATHLRTMVPDVLLTEKFGDVRMTEAFRKINDEYAALTDAAKTEKERSRLEKERQGVVDDLAAIRDRVRGTYAISSELPMRNAARGAQILKNYNVLTSMGSAALSSLPDMAGTVMRHGLVNTFSDAWVPFFKMLTRQDDLWKEAGRQYRAMGIAVESVLASRHHALADTLDTYHPQSRVERTMQWATGKFQFVNMLAPWTDFAKINASMVAGSEILRATKAAAEGAASARQMRTLGESGIEPHMASRIATAFEAGGEIRDGVHLPNTADWADAEARRVFEGAVARDADIAVVTPGQEKPLWMSHPLLSVLGQFKSFTAAATERVLISNLQRRDAQVLQGMLFSMGLGMLSYKINSVTGGQPTSDKPQDWIKESISRGNLLGWFEEGNAMASKVTRGGVDIYRMIGADKPLSRYASRSAMDQILGPTAGKIGGILSVGSAISKPSEWNESDSKALRRLVAGQNTFYLRRLFDQVEASGNAGFGIEMKGKPENR
jgi:hypothetical protein